MSNKLLAVLFFGSHEQTGEMGSCIIGFVVLLCLKSTLSVVDILENRGREPCT